MSDLFRIQTDRMLLVWGAASKEPSPLSTTMPVQGRLAIRPLRPGLAFGPECWRAVVPGVAATRLDLEDGPVLFEQTDYTVYLESLTGDAASLLHRDPQALRDLHALKSGCVLHGTVNFGAQVGRSTFRVDVSGRPELTFEIEVFPSKLDYKADYDRLLADVREILAGMVWEYLRSTYRLGSAMPTGKATIIEWLTLLRHVIGDLEQALERVAQQPQWALTRAPFDVRSDHIRRTDAALRRAIARGAGSGPRVTTQSGIPVHQRLQERRARPTLDTPEHRWLATQLAGIRRRLASLLHSEQEREQSARRDRIVLEIEALERRVSRLGRLSPLGEASGLPPSGFASLQLLTQPGYREAYRACLLLSLGLVLSGAPVEVSLKDLNVLYEYWCYLKTVQLVAEETGNALPAKDLITLERDSLHVLLKKGKEQTARFRDAQGRIASVTYNREFRGDLFLGAQKPDILITLHRAAWPAMQLILDAKYRVDASPEYVDQFDSPGPPQDAINSLHRYRDAILEQESQAEVSNLPKRVVLQAAAAFPYREQQPGAFAKGRLWKGLQRLGVGAIPLLPDSTEYLTEWLRSALHQGGWHLADRAISSQAGDAAVAWRRNAAEPVLVGVLRGGFEREHLAWIVSAQTYYARLTRYQSRQFAVRRLAVYSPAVLREPGAVTHVAMVRAIEVLERGDIRTPWPPARDPHELQVVYRLENATALPAPIVNVDVAGRAARFSRSRWSSVLALERATTLSELLLETEEEWRLYEELRAAGMEFQVRASPARLSDPDAPAGRAWFLAAHARIRYQGADGFVIRSEAGTQVGLPDARRVAACLRQAADTVHDRG